MENRFDRIEDMLKNLEGLLEGLATHKTHYTTSEAAKRLGRAEFTIQQYCRQGVLRAQKSAARRGKFERWVIRADELSRFEREGPFRVQHETQHRG